MPGAAVALLGCCPRSLLMLNDFARTKRRDAFDQLHGDTVLFFFACACSWRIQEERKLLLQARIDWLALECENTEHALVHTSERPPLHEPLEALDPEGELAQRQRALSR